MVPSRASALLALLDILPFAQRAFHQMRDIGEHLRRFDDVIQRAGLDGLHGRAFVAEGREQNDRKTSAAQRHKFVALPSGRR
jgi:hypothetical protein